MKFTKLAKSEKFEYMMLSRLIQDAKYFIEHPDLKHLWARTLDEHIKQIKEQYTKLDPKPEWTSEEEINSLAKQMKESYTNHWNEVHPDNKIEAAIQQPNKPKPTTMLPDNMQWAWDPEAADWVAVLKDNTNTTPPLYDPNNQNVVNQTTSYISTVKSASKKVKSFYDIKGLDNIKMELISFGEGDDLERFELDGIEFYKAKDEELENAIDICLEEEFMPDWEKEGLLSYTIDSIDYNEEDKQGVVYIDLNWGNDKIDASNKQASCLFKFLDGPQYSKEIKIEAGLIKEGLVKYAGFDFNRGTKYSITTKGLEVLRKASEAEHNEALNEREKLAYMFGFNTDEVSTLDTTGKVIKQSARKWTICEADGSELGEVEADSELDAKVKFGIEHPEYADSQSINAKEIKANINEKSDFLPLVSDYSKFLDILTSKTNIKREDAYDKYGNYTYKQWHELLNNLGIKIDAKYEETTESHEPYPNPSETPNDHIILENHDGWVNTASFEDDVRKQFQKPHQKLPNSDRDLALLEKQILEITDEDTRDTVRKIFDEFQFSDKEAAQVTPEFAKLHKLLGEYRKQNLIQLSDLDGNLVASGDPQIINELEHQVKDIGYYCESVDEYTDSDYAETYSLKIFMK